MSMSPKKLCLTRWSSRIDCLTSLNHTCTDLMKVLNEITLNERNKDELLFTIFGATVLGSYFEKYETIVLILSMYNILSKINQASKILQADLGKTAYLIKKHIGQLLAQAK